MEKLEKLLNEAKEKGMPEDFLVEAKKIFEKAVEEKVSTLLEKEVNEKAKLISQFEAEKEELAQNLVEELEKYSINVIRDFLQEKKEEIEEAKRYKRAAEVLNIIEKTLKAYKFDVELNESEKIKELQNELNEYKNKVESLVSENEELKAELDKMKKEMIFENKTKELAETDKEKVRALVGDAFLYPIDEFQMKLNKVVEMVVNEEENSEKDFEVIKENYKFIKEEFEANENDEVSKEKIEEKNNEIINTNEPIFEIVNIAAKLLEK